MRPVRSAARWLPCIALAAPLLAHASAARPPATEPSTAQASPSPAATSSATAPSPATTQSEAGAPAALHVTGSCFKKQEGQCLETPMGIEQSGCEMMGGTALAGPCPVKERIGTCRQTVHGVETASVHYYTGSSLAPTVGEAKTLCDGKRSDPEIDMVWKFVPGR